MARAKPVLAKGFEGKGAKKHAPKSVRTPININPYIPFVPQRDPNNFPPVGVEYQHYPMMMVHESGQPFIDGSGDPIIVSNEDEERKFRDANPDTMAPTQRPEDIQSELANLRAENRRLRGSDDDKPLAGLVKPGAEDNDDASDQSAALPGSIDDDTETMAAGDELPKPATASPPAPNRRPQPQRPTGKLR